MDKLFCHLFLWISYGQFVHSNIMNDNFICISGFKLTDTPILDINITVGNGSVIKCFAHCSRMENCKSVPVKKDSTLCRLYDVSIAAIGSSPVQDVDWDTFTYKGRLVLFFRFQTAAYWQLAKFGKKEPLSKTCRKSAHFRLSL